jgi:DNA-binding PadR family transcriptional regulator
MSDWQLALSRGCCGTFCANVHTIATATNTSNQITSLRRSRTTAVYIVRRCMGPRKTGVGVGSDQDDTGDVLPLGRNLSHTKPDRAVLEHHRFIPYNGRKFMADRPGHFDLMILLAVLRLDDNAYGVPIATEIENTTGRSVALATLYAALERLESKGWVSSRLGESTAERGGRAKRYFRVTSKGLGQAREAKRALVKMWRGIRKLQEGTT